MVLGKSGLSTALLVPSAQQDASLLPRKCCSRCILKSRGAAA